MNKEQKMVLDFHKKYEVVYYNTPLFPSEQVKELRKTLVKEESEEISKALDAYDMIELADALADTLYVVYGTAISYGIDLEPIFKEVHRSNMTKTGSLRDDGKILKGKDWKKPNLQPILDEQGKIW